MVVWSKSFSAHTVDQSVPLTGLVRNLPAALEESQKLQSLHRGWPPVNSGADPTGRGLAGVMDDEMGFLD